MAARKKYRVTTWKKLPSGGYEKLQTRLLTQREGDMFRWICAELNLVRTAAMCQQAHVIGENLLTVESI